MALPFFNRNLVRWTVFVGLPVFLVLMGALLVHRELAASANDRIDAALSEAAHKDSQAIIKGLTAYGEAVESISGLFNASDTVERDEFEIFARLPLNKFPGIQALEWVPRVPRVERSRQEQLAREAGFEGWRILKYQPDAPEPWTAADEDWAEEYFPVYYVEPEQGNEQAFGIDLNSHPYRRKALELARDRGEPQATAGIRLAQGGDNSLGLLYVMPIYTTKNIPPAELRRETLQGYALGVFRVAEIVRPLLRQGEGNKTLTLRITDVTEEDQPQELFSDGDRTGQQPPSDHERRTSKRLTASALTVVIPFGGRRLKFEFFPTAEFLDQTRQQEKGKPWLYLVGWLLLGGTLGILMNSIVNRSRKVEKLVEQRSAELAQAEARFRTLFDSNSSGLLVTDDRGVIRLVNPAVQEIFGYRDKELIDQKVELLVPESRRQDHVVHRSNYSKNPVHRAMGEALRLHGQHKDGRQIPVEVSLVPVTVSGKKMVLANIQDVTEKRQAETALAQAFEDLRRSNVELQQFAYVASHDLQEPLRAIHSFSELLGQRCRGQIGAEAEEFLQFIMDGAKRAQTLIHDLLAFSRVGTHGKPFVETNCEQVLDNALKNLQLAIADSHALIERDPLPTIEGDETQLTQLFQNLLGNALKFCRAGDTPRIQVRARQLNSSQWQISVQDNGMGIDPEHHERIFVIFQRLHSHEEYPGTGIGLAICKKIVNRHGGTLWVESVPGQGSTFSFTLAVDGTGPGSESPANETRRQPGQADEDTLQPSLMTVRQPQ